jgi:hypothetical protein
MIMEAFRWKSLFSLDGSERSFMERVRAPDAGFPNVLRALAMILPFGFVFLMIPVLVLPILTEAVLGPQSSIAQLLYVVSFYGLKLITWAIVLTIFGMYGLRNYVALKLRRQKRHVS